MLKHVQQLFIKSSPFKPKFLLLPVAREYDLAVIIVPTLLVLASVVILVAVCLLRWGPKRRRTRTRVTLPGIDGENPAASPVFFLTHTQSKFFFFDIFLYSPALPKSTSWHQPAGTRGVTHVRSATSAASAEREADPPCCCCCTTTGTHGAVRRGLQPGEGPPRVLPHPGWQRSEPLQSPRGQQERHPEGA